MAVIIDRTKFYAALRKRGSGVFGVRLGAEQVRGLENILDEALRRSTPLTWLSYILATTYHETATTMQPIRERGGAKYFARYEGRKDLGNTMKGDGVKFHGRGFVMLTGRRNYAYWSKLLGIDLVANPDKALDLGISTRILFEGMEKGTFTGKKLADYKDFVSMRRIINGTDRDKLIAGYAGAFRAALQAAGYTLMSNAPTPAPGKTDAPVAPLETPPIARKTLLAALVTLFAAIVSRIKR